ncbi:hypothetical protein Bpfe_018630 [Biomphalaria pfeifferi]|uniref:Uncharacterized protein n=1 Tax=Biomphalaria pfeifferi TaxID=112525 RepID=A0AAD8F5C8_BIOPF|nr:hypothetical protein Bpfe_018630 [Biomphalaria pfeifferi]
MNAFDNTAMGEDVFNMSIEMSSPTSISACISVVVAFRHPLYNTSSTHYTKCVLFQCTAGGDIGTSADN